MAEKVKNVKKIQNGGKNSKISKNPKWRKINSKISKNLKISTKKSKNVKKVKKCEKSFFFFF
jgi:hypothetical protein